MFVQLLCSGVRPVVGPLLPCTIVHLKLLARNPNFFRAGGPTASDEATDELADDVGDDDDDHVSDDVASTLHLHSLMINVFAACNRVAISGIAAPWLWTWVDQASTRRISALKLSQSGFRMGLTRRRRLSNVQHTCSTAVIVRKQLLMILQVKYRISSNRSRGLLMEEIRYE